MSAYTRYGILFLIVLGAAGIVSVYMPLDSVSSEKEKIQSLRIVDRRGVLLREALNDEQGRSVWKPLKEIAPSLQQATIAVEDKRFTYHPGVDPIAIVRSLVVNIRSHSFASGGSTITQQVVRSIYPHPRTLGAKVTEAWYALRLERKMSKNEILEQYLNRVPYGNNIRGVEAAAQFYFHKHASDVSLAEAAFLAALPNAPSLLDPYTHLRAAEARQRIVLRRMLDQGFISHSDQDRAAAQPLPLQPPASVFRAPHVCDMVVKEYGAINAAAVMTTIDEALQEQIVPIVNTHVQRLARKNVTNAAVVIIENATGAIRVLIGSNEYFSERTSGQVNGVLALRQPGSAIKPLMYALAMDKGHAPSEIVPDIPTAIPDTRGDYIPENYDKTFHGPVSIRTALACSYNVPAVRVLEAVGKEQFLQKLHGLGFTALTQSSDFYGCGLTLGNGEVSLLELTNAYRALANHGEWRPFFIVSDVTSADGTHAAPSPPELPRTVYSREAAFLVSDILSDAAARRPAFGSAFRFPFACAVKTGTTKDYKDNWTVGYTSRYTVGVWAGNFNGSPMQGVSGVTGAGQIFTDIMTLLHSAPYGTVPEKFEIPDGVEQKTLCPRSGKAPTRACPYHVTDWVMKKNNAAPGSCTVHRRFLVRDERGIPQDRVYELYPPEYAAWQQSKHLPVPPADAVPAEHATDNAGPGRARLAIASPNNGDVFKIDPSLRREYQTMRIRGFAPAGAADVTLTIDNAGSIPFSPNGHAWTLQKGVHRFQLFCLYKSRRMESTIVSITVE